MVELRCGLRPKEPGGRSANLVRADGRKLPTHRCLVPASDFRVTRQGKCYRFSLADGDWFYFAGIWRPSVPDWPEAYAILTIEANVEVAPYNDRQGRVEACPAHGVAGSVATRGRAASAPAERDIPGQPSVAL